MKTLANCKPSEFLKQTNRIKKSVEKWLTATDIMNIRKSAPKAPVLEGLGESEKREAVEDYKRRQQEQAKKNVSKILDAILEEHPDETLELLALLCFVEPEDVDNHTMTEYLTAVSDMLSDEAVIGFFSSLARWGVTVTSN